jgi:nitrile hydratase subunit alpha
MNPHDHDRQDGHHHAEDEHRHRPRKDLDDTLTYYRAMEIALRELLIEKGVLTADAIRSQVEDMDNRSPAAGARVVAKAWVDPEYKAMLLADGGAACVAIGLDRGPYRLVVVENTPGTHNMIVCTLCSCYPRWLLGLPPDWYKSRNYRSRVVREPRSVLREFGTEIDDDIIVRVHDSTADMRYLVLPQRPPGTEGWDEERLARLVTRDCMIGVSLPRPA